MISKKTKIVCTIGPASEKLKTLERMIKAGMNVARLNFSHGTYENFEKMINNIRAASRKLNIPVAIMQDLQGPKIRVGKMPEEGVHLEKGQKIELTSEEITGSTALIPIKNDKLLIALKKEDVVLLNDGLIELKVTGTDKNNVKCNVTIGGLLKSHRGVNFPTVSVDIPSITAKDKKDLAFGLKHDVDFVALSFVQSAKDIEELRSLIRKQKGRVKIVAKIEHHDAIKNLAEIIHEADAVMVARGDLGVEISPERVPLIQKKIIHLANLHGKPVITATEVLLSMMENARATRAEVSDAANAVFDHSDAIMLSQESAMGKYPVKSTRTLSKVAASTENGIKRSEKFLPQKLFKETVPVSYAICEAGAKMAKNINAKVIVAITKSGFTAQHIAKHRVYIPIIVITDDPKTEKQMQLVWGVEKVALKKNLNLSNPIAQVRKILLAAELVQKDDKVVIISNASHEEKLISTIII